MQENVFTLIGRMLDKAKKNDVTIHLFFDNEKNPTTNMWQVQNNCKHWEVTPNGVRSANNQNAANLSSKVLNAEIVKKTVLPGDDKWHVVVRYPES